MLARVRESAEAQLRMYREESEQIFSSSLTALKAQIDTDTKKIEELTNRNVRMVGEIGELMATVRKMEGQVGIITLTPYMVLPLFATRFADYAGGIRVSFI